MPSKSPCAAQAIIEYPLVVLMSIPRIGPQKVGTKLESFIAYEHMWNNGGVIG